MQRRADFGPQKAPSAEYPNLGFRNDKASSTQRRAQPVKEEDARDEGWVGVKGRRRMLGMNGVGPLTNLRVLDYKKVLHATLYTYAHGLYIRLLHCMCANAAC